MSKAGVCVVVVAALTRVAMAQPSDQPPVTPPATPEATTATPPAPPTPPAPAPEQAPPAKPSVYAQCMEQRHRLSEEASHENDLQERTRLLQSMPECNPEMDHVPQSPAASDGGSDEESPTATGFALEMRLSTDQVQIDSNSFLPVMDTGLFIGHHGGKLTIGIGLELSRITSASSFSGGVGPMDQSTSFTSILVMPGLRGTLARSSDQKTELIGAVDVGYGASWSSSSDSMASDSPTISHFRVQVGPGLRYWVSRSFAVGGIGGLRYDRQSRDSTDGTATQSLSNTSVYGSLSLTGVF